MAVIQSATISFKGMLPANHIFFKLHVGHIYVGDKVSFLPLIASNSQPKLAVEDLHDFTPNSDQCVVLGPHSVKHVYRTCGRDEPEDNAIARASHCGFVKLEWIDTHRRFRGCLNICDRDACNQANLVDYSSWRMTFCLTLLFFSSFASIWWSTNHAGVAYIERYYWHEERRQISSGHRRMDERYRLQRDLFETVQIKS